MARTMTKNKKSYKELISEAKKGAQRLTEITSELVSPLKLASSELENKILQEKLLREGNQRIVRLLIALYKILDLPSEENKEAILSRGQVSRTQYDALVYEFFEITRCFHFDKLKWDRKNQSAEALKEIVEQYREATDPNYK